MRTMAIALLLATLFLSLPPSAGAAEACQFVLGFKALHDAIPDKVGDCLANQSYTPDSGDAVQQTIAWHGQGGLLVWRKADNWTAYTDGSTTWVNGPFGIQRRANTERFAWEADYSKMVRASLNLSHLTSGAGSFAAASGTSGWGSATVVTTGQSSSGRVTASQTVRASSSGSQSGTRVEATIAQTLSLETEEAARAALAAWKPDGWEPVSAPTIGDESVAYRRTLSDATGAEMVGYAILFRRDSLLGLAVGVGQADRVSLDDVVATARGLE